MVLSYLKGFFYNLGVDYCVDAFIIPKFIFYLQRIFTYTTDLGLG
jgi:hypothetical protein